MPPKRARKSASKASILTPPAAITLGEELQLDPLAITLSIEAPIEPTSLPAEHSYPHEPLLPSNDLPPLNDIEPAAQQASRESSAKGEDDNRLTWTEEMLKQLVETLYKVFKGGPADNSFKKTTFQAAVPAVRQVYRGSHP
jgi:hypothetical protein